MYIPPFESAKPYIKNAEEASVSAKLGYSLKNGVKEDDNLKWENV